MWVIFLVVVLALIAFSMIIFYIGNKVFNRIQRENIRTKMSEDLYEKLREEIKEEIGKEFTYEYKKIEKGLD